MGIKGRGKSGTSRDSNPACLCCSSAHLVQCEPDEASSFTNPNVGPGTYASLRLKLDAWSSAYKGDKSAARPPEGCPAEAGGLFGPESAHGFEHPSGTNARRPSQMVGGVPQITRPAEVLPGNWRGSDRDWSAVFDARPTLRACMAQGLFWGVTGRRAVAHTRPEFVKNTLGPFGIPLVRGASGAGQWTQPSRRR